MVLDLLLDREPYASHAENLLSRAEAGEVNGCLCATTVTTLYYLAAKAVGPSQALTAVRDLLAFLEIAPVNRSILEAALDSDFLDFEDAVLHEAARQASTQAIVTRNLGDFKKAVLPVYSPEELVKALDLQDRSAD